MIEKKILAKIRLGQEKHLWAGSLYIGYFTWCLTNLSYVEVDYWGRGEELLMPKLGDRLKWERIFLKVGFNSRGQPSIYENMETMCPPNSHQQLKDLGPYVRLYIMCKIIIWVCKFLPPSQKFLQNKTSERTWSVNLYHHRH